MTDRPIKDPRYNKGGPELDAFQKYRPAKVNLRQKGAASKVRGKLRPISQSTFIKRRGHLKGAAALNPRRGYLRDLAKKRRHK
jgi:hypothetical protein